MTFWLKKNQDKNNKNRKKWIYLNNFKINNKSI